MTLADTPATCWESSGCTRGRFLRQRILGMNLPKTYSPPGHLAKCGGCGRGKFPQAGTQSGQTSATVKTFDTATGILVALQGKI